MTGDSEKITGVYNRIGGLWDADRRAARFVERGWLDRFIAMVPDTGRVLDLGCGGGQPMAEYLIAHGRNVTGIDGSPRMIELCRARFPAQDWRVHDMRGLALGRAFDGVLAWDSFFHLSPGDQRAMFPVFRAHAAPGAPLLFSSGPRHGEAVGALHGEPLYHASLAPDEYRALLAANGFAVVDHVAEDPDCAGHTVWLARREKAR